MQIFAQCIGLVGMALAFVSFQSKSSRGILFFQILASSVFSLHFFLLGAYTGMAMNLVGVARNAVSYCKDKRWASGRCWMYVFIAAYLITGILTWESVFSIFPIVAMVLSTVAFWIKDANLLRLVYFPSSPCWLVYNIASRSVAGILTESFSLVSLLIAFIRFQLLGKEKKEEGNPDALVSELQERV